MSGGHKNGKIITGSNLERTSFIDVDAADLMPGGKHAGGSLILPGYTELDAAKKQRNAALRSLDIAWARRAGGVDTATDEQVLGSLHMARYECDEIEDRLRFQSRDWLKARGLGRLHGLPFEEGDKLPAGLV